MDVNIFMRKKILFCIGIISFNCLMAQDIAFVALCKKSSLENDHFSFMTDNKTKKAAKKIKHESFVWFMDPLQLLFKAITVGGEKINKTNTIGYRIPVTVGLGTNKKYTEVAFDMKYYFSNKDTALYSMGEIDLGEATPGYFAGPSFLLIYSKSDFVAGMNLSGGYSLQFLQGMNISVYGAIGPRYYFINSTGESPFKMDWSFNTSIGWRIVSKK